MTDNRLILTTTNPGSIPLQAKGGVAGLIEALQHLDFIGAAVTGSTMEYHSGSKIMNSISLVGCSPIYSLTSEPGDDPAGIVSFSPVYKAVQFIYGINSMTPKCPHCSEPLNTWQQSLPGPLVACDTLEWLICCERCMKSVDLNSLRFRREAALGRFFIYVHGIYPHEAVPMDAFLVILEQYLGSPVAYFYCQGQ